MHFNINPAELSDEEWATLYRQYEFVERQKQKQQQQTFENALIKVLNQAFGNGNE